MKKLIAILLSIIFLTACSSKYKVDVDLTPEDIKAVETKISETKNDIENYKGEEGSIPFREIIILAKEYEKLGDLGKAIDLYGYWLGQGYKTRSLINNLGRLYEKVNETELAVEQYQRLINEYNEDRYLYDITWAYIKAGERKLAEKYFNLWQLKFQKTDTQTQQAIKKLRDAEKTVN